VLLGDRLGVAEEVVAGHPGVDPIVVRLGAQIVEV
jgi:hypothetical protein